MKLYYKKLKAAGWEKEKSSSDSITFTKINDSGNEMLQMEVVFKGSESDIGIYFYGEALVENKKTGLEEVVEIMPVLFLKDLDGIFEMIKHYKMEVSDANWYKEEQTNEA